jgi:hypothetical protein
VLKHVDAQGLSCGGRRTIRCDDERSWLPDHWILISAQTQRHVGRLLQPGQKQPHQRTVVEDPADGLVTTVLAAQILLAEQNATSTPCIAQVQPGEGNECIAQGCPELQTLK